MKFDHDHRISPDFSMTATTHRYLEARLGELTLKRGGSASSLGGADFTSGLHDDPAVVRDMQDLDRDISKIEAILKNSEILSTQDNINKIGIGNKIVLEFVEEEGKEVYRLGTEIDASYNSDGIPWVSVKSPLGQVLLGKEKGILITYKVSELNLGVRIKDILPEE